MTTRNNNFNRLAEEFSIPEDVEEESGRFEESFLRMRAPLLPSDGAHHDNDTNDGSNDWPLRHHHPQQQHRILDRSGDFRQSRGRWGVERRLSRDPFECHDDEERRRQGQRCCFNGCFSSIFRCCCCRRRSSLQHYYGCGKDWFFWLAYKKTIVLFLLLFLSYAFIIGFFGFIYLALSIFGSKAEVNPDGSTKTIAFCDMDINDHMEAMYFSLSTMTTIGYGVSDYYFGGCYSPLLIVLLQTCIAIVFDAVAVGLIFHRISRGASRSRSILFSDKAIVRTIKGVPHLMFRLGEKRKYHLIEATVRCYCIKHERLPSAYPVTTDTETAPQIDDQNGTEDFQLHIETTPFVSRQMRLIQPDDRFGSHLWMGLPQVVVHRIDEKSPLMPSSPLWFDVGGNAHTYPPLQNQEEERKMSSSESLSGKRKKKNHSHNLGCIQDFLRDRDMELVVLVEGTDEGTGAATQARHSYKLWDIAWNHRFADCVAPYSRRQRRGPSSLDPVVSIDFGKFHDILPAPVDCNSCAYVPDQ